MPPQSMRHRSKILLNNNKKGRDGYFHRGLCYKFVTDITRYQFA